MAPPPVPLKQENFIIKTPRPDSTFGFHLGVVVEKLEGLGLKPVAAKDFLNSLQLRKQLCSSPMPSALNVRFPSLVVEGKSYATGRTIYEAQNQAAVSGSCMLNLQHQLADLTKRAAPGSVPIKEPLAFTICTQGPIMELWVHYTTSSEEARYYNMAIVESCHGSLRKTVREFLVAMEGVIQWASSELLCDVTQQLSLVWKAAQQQVSA